MTDPLRVRPATLAEATAVKAFLSGEATAHQQGLVRDYLLYELCRYDRDVFMPGERETAYLAGRRSVGVALRSIATAPLKSQE